MGWSTWNNGNCEHEDTCCGLRGELGAIKFRTLLHILHHLAEIVLYLHIADVGGWRQQTPQICQAAASSQRCAATYKLGVQNISCICNFYPEFIFLHLREKEPISAAKSFNIIGSLKKITYVLDLHNIDTQQYSSYMDQDLFYICYFLHFQASLIHFGEGMFDI